MSRGYTCFNALRPRQNGCYFPDDIFKWIFLNGNVWIAIKVSLKFVPKVSINNIPPLVQIMAWRRPGDKPLSEPMMVILLTHICVTRPQWVKQFKCQKSIISSIAITSYCKLASSLRVSEWNGLLRDWAIKKWLYAEDKNLDGFPTRDLPSWSESCPEQGVCYYLWFTPSWWSRTLHRRSFDVPLTKK